MYELPLSRFQKPGDSVIVPLIDDVRHLAFAFALLELIKPMTHSLHKLIMDLRVDNHMIAG